MKGYLFFIEKNKLNNDILSTLITKEIQEINNKEYILYAYTNKKTYKEIFLKERISSFKCIECDLDNEKVIDDLFYFKLDYRELRNYNYSIKMLCTGYEYDASHEGWINFIIPDNVYKYLSMNMTSRLQDKYFQALTSIGLNTLIAITGDNDSDAYYFDRLEFNDSLSVLEVQYSDLHWEISFDIKGKEINIFIHIFKSLLRMK